MPARTASSTACRFSTGSTPGIPMHRGQTFSLGAAPNAVEHPQNIFDLVERCAWTSRPITASYFSVFMISNFQRMRRKGAESFVGVADTEHDFLAERRADDLQSDRQTGPIIAAWYRHSRQSREVHRNRENVREIHRQRVVGFFAKLERGGRRDRRHHDVAGFERALEVAPNQRTDLLTLQIIGVVVAGREREGAKHDAAFDLGAEALRARFLI